MGFFLRTGWVPLFSSTYRLSSPLPFFGVGWWLSVFRGWREALTKCEDQSGLGGGVFSGLLIDLYFFQIFIMASLGFGCDLVTHSSLWTFGGTSRLSRVSPWITYLLALVIQVFFPICFSPTFILLDFWRCFSWPDFYDGRFSSIIHRFLWCFLVNWHCKIFSARLLSKIWFYKFPIFAVSAFSKRSLFTPVYHFRCWWVQFIFFAASKNYLGFSQNCIISSPYQPVLNRISLNF